ncbi:DUF6403 family protein [Actinophytocola oryzae]|uniref:DUF6403 family protein n=1 Tax=Actinophytocola oryzae TaxID=502181 RepID=UPI00312C8381
MPWARDRGLRRRTAWSAARAAIESASVSRDAVGGELPGAEELLARAVLLAAHRGGVAAAEEAADCASRADALWRGVAG